MEDTDFLKFIVLYTDSRILYLLTNGVIMIKARNLGMLDKCSAIELYPSPGLKQCMSVRA